MGQKRGHRYVISDEFVPLVLTAKTARDAADQLAELGVAVYEEQCAQIRSMTSKRVLKIADAIGLKRSVKSRRVWVGQNGSVAEIDIVRP